MSELSNRSQFQGPHQSAQDTNTGQVDVSSTCRNDLFAAYNCDKSSLIVQFNSFLQQMHPMIVRGVAKVESQMHEQLEEAYELFDSRNKGWIDSAGLAEAMKVLGYELDDRKQIQEMIAVLDENQKGTISRDEFKKFMTARMDYRDDAEELRQAYEYFMSPYHNKVGPEDLRRVAEELGEDQSQCVRMVLESDKDEDGWLSYEQLVRCIKKTSYY